MDFIDKIKIWLPKFNEHIELMKKTEQDPEWHGEGDVWNHTLMVLNEVEKITSLKESDKSILRWTALLHDIGKPYCSKEVDGHIRSHGHSKIGYNITIDILQETHLTTEEKKQIRNIIRVHGEPNWILERKEPERDIIKMSLECRLDLLYHFVNCDIKGRISEEKDDFFLSLEYFKELSKELNCYNKPYNFKSDIAKFNYLVKRTHHHSDKPFDDTKSTVFMVCGLPGSGKDTYINKNLTFSPVISLDEIRKELKLKPTDKQGLVIQTAKEKAREYMRKGVNFIWNATNITKKMRSELISFFVDYNSYVSIIFINKPLETVLEQNKNRDKIVPENVILKLYNKMEIPNNSEAHKVRIIS